MYKFCSSSFGSLHVFSLHAITVVAVWHATQITRLNVYVKMALLENIARKVCTLSLFVVILLILTTFWFFFLFFNSAILFYVFTKSTPPKYRGGVHGPACDSPFSKSMQPNSLQIPIRFSCINSKKILLLLKIIFFSSSCKIMQGGIWRSTKVSDNNCLFCQTDLSCNFLTYDAGDADVTRRLELRWTRK